MGGYLVSPQQLLIAFDCACAVHIENYDKCLLWTLFTVTKYKPKARDAKSEIFIVSKRLRSTIKSDSRLFGSFENGEILSQGSLNVRNRLEKNGAG